CVRGAPCYQDPDCADGSTCNGAERCISGRCVAGLVPVSDDGIPCTLDACVEPGGVVHLPDPESDGRSCSAEGGGAGLCVSGGCALSICGDALIDPATETCDDGNDNPNDGCDACRSTRWSPTVISGLDSARGDPLSLAIHPEGLALDGAGNVFILSR